MLLKAQLLIRYADGSTQTIVTKEGIAMVLGDTALTMTGEVVGSPEYLAPEQASGRSLGPATDLWSLGVLLFTAVQGRSPFRQDSALGTLRAVVDDEPPLPNRAGPLAPVIEGLLRKDPAVRASAEQTARDLRLVGAGATPDADTTATGSAPTAAFSAVSARTGGIRPSAQSSTGDTADTATTTVDAPTGQAHHSPRPPSFGTTATDATATDGTTTDSTAAGATGTPAAPLQASSGTSVTATGDTRPVSPSPQSSPVDDIVTSVARTPAASANPATPLTPLAPLTPLTPPQAPPPHSLPTAPVPVTAEAPASLEPGRSRRTGYLLAALAAVSVLLLGGLGYALMNIGDEDGADAKGPAANTANTGSATQQAQNDSPSAGNGGSDAGAQPPVTVSVTGATTRWAFMDKLTELGAVPASARVVEHLEQRTIVAAGVSSGIDVALRLAELLTDQVTAQAMQLTVEYDPQPPFDAGSVEKAGPLVTARAKELFQEKD
ncbi:hypothetical protein AB0D14_31315 [Streptomyces sp. NPDC048484]|uniref:protein kinase domain-containing protein n=1 Tax=Streptomyces sp. NPDC048484 TaxID=3155146 RepID=UPI003442B7A1